VPRADPRASPVPAFPCPSCRKMWTDEDVAGSDMTAGEQWDALLEVAKAWAQIDRRREVETSEEEAEEAFINDEESDLTEEGTQEDEGTDETRAEGVVTSHRLRRGSNAQQRSSDVIAAEDTTALGTPADTAILANKTVLNAQGKSSTPLPSTAGSLHTTTTSVTRASSSHQLLPSSRSPSPSRLSENSASQLQSVPRGPTYSESPRDAKRKRMQDLAAARANKKRLL
jgi:hypothetical protein